MLFYILDVTPYTLNTCSFWNKAKSSVGWSGCTLKRNHHIVTHMTGLNVITVGKKFWRSIVSSISNFERPLILKVLSFVNHLGYTYYTMYYVCNLYFLLSLKAEIKVNAIFKQLWCNVCICLQNNWTPIALSYISSFVSTCLKRKWAFCVLQSCQIEIKVFTTLLCVFSLSWKKCHSDIVSWYSKQHNFIIKMKTQLRLLEQQLTTFDIPLFLYFFIRHYLFQRPI